MWQEVSVVVIVGLAVAYLGHKVFGIGRSDGPSAAPDVKASSLVRKPRQKSEGSRERRGGL